MYTWIDQLIKINFVVWGICLIIFSFIATIKLSIPKDSISQAERIRRSLIVGVAVTLLAPGMILIAYGFSSEKTTWQVIPSFILISICFSPIGLAAAFGTYSRLWGWTKMPGDLLFLDENKKTKD